MARPGKALAFLLAAGLAPARAAPPPVCQSAGTPVTVADASHRLRAGAEARPALIDRHAGFAWPDTPIGTARVADGLAFFASDGGAHKRREGGTRRGSVVRTLGTLEDPLGTAPPLDGPILPNPDPAISRNAERYRYVGGGPVLRVPAGQPGAGKLLMVTHSEITTPDTRPAPSFYSVLGLAASSDDGRSWTDLGDIISPNHPYAPDAQGFEIGDQKLAVSPDGAFAYVYFRDWLGTGAQNLQTVTRMSVARVDLAGLLDAAFGPHPHAAAFAKYQDGAWTQPGLGGAASDLAPHLPFGSEHQVSYDAALHAWLDVMGGQGAISLATSPDGLAWSAPVTLTRYPKGTQLYVMTAGAGPDPELLGRDFAVLYTWFAPQDGGWHTAELRRLDVSCH